MNLDLDPPLIESWAELYQGASQDQNTLILEALCKHISILNFFDRKEYSAYILKRHRELNEEERIEAFRRQRAADLKKLDDRIMERKRNLK